MVDPALRARLLGGEAVVAGVLSGTSADGIDVVLANVVGEGGRVGRVRALAFATEPYPEALGARVRDVLDGAPTGLRDVALLHRDLGRAFGGAARAVAERHGLRLDLVASHGQTVWHHDGVEASGPATLQLGDGDEVAEAAGAAVVSDFRMRDVAAGGEGAPLSALADPVVFADAPRPLVVLNLGGIANVTLVGGAAGDLRAFDVGPANALLDGLARRLLHAPLDEGGAAAARGAADAGLVDAVLAHPFLALPAPKSTGRDTFGAAWLDEIVRRASDVAPEDVLASAARAIARAVAEALHREGATSAGPLLVAGGGVHHGPLMAELADATGIETVPSDAVGVPADAREALVFAVLGARHACGEPSTHAGATGARADRVLGKSCAAPPVSRGREGGNEGTPRAGSA